MSRAQYVPSCRLQTQIDALLQRIEEREHENQLDFAEVHRLKRYLRRSVELERQEQLYTDDVPESDRVFLSLGDVFRKVRREFEAQKTG